MDASTARAITLQEKENTEAMNTDLVRTLNELQVMAEARAEELEAAVQRVRGLEAMLETSAKAAMKKVEGTSLQPPVLCYYFFSSGYHGGDMIPLLTCVQHWRPVCPKGSPTGAHCSRLTRLITTRRSQSWCSSGSQWEAT